MILVPVGLGYFLTYKLKLGWSLWWAGAATFILSQLVHIPFNLLVLNPLLEGRSIFIISIALGLSAGIFEELARYGTYRWWRKDARSWGKGVLLGAGHGGIEAIILGVLVLYTFIQQIAFLGVDLSTIIPEEHITIARQQINIYWTLPWYLSLFGALERIFTIPFHIAVSVIVLQIFTRGQLRWLWLAIGWHALVDALAILSASLWGVYIAEAIIGIVALISLLIIFILRQPEVAEYIPEPAPLPAPVLLSNLSEPIITDDTLDKTRYVR